MIEKPPSTGIAVPVTKSEAEIGRKIACVQSPLSWRVPLCDPRDPSVIPHDSQPYLKLAPSTQFVSVELTYRDGSVSEIKSFRR
jgi:hypothetical protein